MRLSKQQRGDVIVSARERLAKMPHIPPTQGCVFLACFTCLAIAKRGPRAVLQAGSASFRFKALSEDDGGDTHLSYEFNPKDPASLASLAQGSLPEIHCWAGIPETGEIVDLSTAYLVDRLAQSGGGLTWTAPVPPAEIWCGPGQLPDGFIYSASLPATLMVFTFLRKARPDIFAEMARLKLTPPE